MAKFLTGNELNTELEKIFELADEQIHLISPYIKLHDRYISTFLTKKDNPKLEIIIVFGKNEADLSKSMKQDDFNFFKEFPNIQIRYEKRLHAKYYASESTAILTSMNLYSYSQDNNIEAGVMTKVTLLGNLANNLLTNVTGEDSFDNQAYSYFKRVIDQSDLLFHKTPRYDKGTLGTGLNKKYISSETKVDTLSDFFLNKQKTSSRKLQSKNNKINQEEFQKLQTNKIGYCIRTGESIPFNLDRPLSDKAFNSWSKYKDEDYKEKFCHYSGEKSNGETSFAKPIIKKNWNKSKEK